MTQATSVSIAQAAVTLASAQGVTQRCVSLATGTLGPDLRVNYEFGLVLGVDEFRQEQLYFLDKEYQHNRSLHGFGTVYGLTVSTATPPGSQDDLQITIAPGMAIDQYGRAIIVRADQCARLGAWLAKQVQADPEIIDKQRAGVSGELSVYVVLSYAECPDMLVPIPGQPCDNADDSTAPSRIRDSYRIELRWKPPAMPAWDAVRRFAELIALVRPVPALPPEQSDEGLLAALIRQLDDPDGYATALATVLAGSPSDLPRELFRLPAATAGAALDRLYTIWATEVRPSLKLPPDLNDPEPPIEAGVLLARIDFLPDDPFDTQRPTISFPRDAHNQPVQPDAEGRPFLLHTQLIQELRDAGAATEKREFATLSARDGATLRVWVHYDEMLDQPDPTALELTVDTGPVTITAIATVAPNVFDLTLEPAVIDDSPQGPPLPPGALVALRFLLEGVTAGGRPLIDEIDTIAVDYTGRAGVGLTVYTVVSAGVQAQQPVQEFVQIQTVRIDGALRFRLWFHTPTAITLPKSIRTQRGVGPNATQHNFAVVQTTVASGTQFFWVLAPPANLKLSAGDVLTFSFATSEIMLSDDQTTLADSIASDHLNYLGYDGIGTIRAFHVVSPPSEPGISIDQVNELIKQAIDQLPPPTPRPTLPFVTITPLSFEGPLFELWFHPTGDPHKNDAVIDEKFTDTFPFEILAELRQRGGLIDLRQDAVLRPIRPNVFLLQLNHDIWQKASEESRWLRFVFRTPDIIVDNGGKQQILSEYMHNLPFALEGALDEKVIVVYTRLTQPGGQ